MLKSNKSNLIINNAIELGDNISLEDKGKGRHFTSRFIEAGLAHYQEFGDVLITKETLDKFVYTMVGCPVIIRHKDITAKNVDKERVGVVSKVWYNELDGWFWCEGIIWDKQAIDLIKNQGWSVSCTYDFESDFKKGTYHGKDYDMEFTGGEFLHLALVDNPRYERANIVVNSKDEVENEADFTSQFKEALFTAINEVAQEHGFGELKVCNDKWITIKPHGKDADDYKRLKLEDGETPKEGMKRVYGVDIDKGYKEEEKQNKKSFKERIEEKRQDYDYSYAKLQEVNKEISQFEDKINELAKDISDWDEIKKIAQKYKQEHHKEVDDLQKKYKDANDKFLEKEKEFDQLKLDIADEIVELDYNKLNDNELDTLRKDILDFSYLSGIPYEKRKALQEKLFNIKQTIYRRIVKAKADEVGGYTKKLNDIAGFTEFSDISSLSDDLQKHIYNNYKTVYDRYPQIRYGGLKVQKLADNTYASNLSQTNRITLNSTKYNDLNTLKASYENDVREKYHPEGTDYNSIVVHELGHGLQQYIEKKYKITAPDIRATVLKKVGIKQKDVGEHLSMYAMKKPREAHEFFSEAFAEYMTSKNPRPLAVEFGKEINRILNQK